MMDLTGEGMERRMSGGAGVLSGVTPITRSGVVDGSGVVTASSVAASAPGGGGGVSTAGGGGLPGPVVSQQQQQQQQQHQHQQLPANAQYNPKTTHVQNVPLVDSEKTIPPLSEDEIKQVQVWMKADREYEGLYKKMQQRMVEDVKDVIVKSRAWWEKDPMQDPMVGRRRGTKFEVVGLKSQRDERVRRPKVGRREGFKLYVFFSSFSFLGVMCWADAVFGGDVGRELSSRKRRSGLSSLFLFDLSWILIIIK